jgi:hypothetical protein
MKFICNICKKIKTMSDLIFDKQRNEESNLTTRMPSITRKQLRFVKPAMLSIVYAGFITLSLKNDNLFLTEMLVSGGIIAIVYFVHLLSQND